MSDDQPDLPFVTAFLLELLDTAVIHLGFGLLFALFAALLGLWPGLALASGLAWGFLMWISCGALLALSIAWRPSAALPAASRQAFGPAIERACERFRLVILADSPARVVLVPKRIRHILVIPARLRRSLQKIHIDFADGKATFTAPALIFLDLKSELKRASRDGGARTT
jgi:hypothetical protein